MDVLTTMLTDSWGVLTEMSPYLLFGFLVAGVLSVVISPETVERHLGGKGFGPVFKAAAFGVPLPLCSCGVIPVGASLCRHGATRGATTAFLLSTPQTGVDSILVTLGLLGPIYAIFRPIAALVTGVVGGVLVTLFGGANGEADAPPPCQDACCTGNGGNKAVAAFRYAFVTLPRDIGKALVIGLLAAGLISALVPDDYFAGLLGTGLGAMFAMMLLGLPVYVCATASVPIAVTLIAKGVSPGAALVFLMTGPATNAATMATVWRVMGRRTALIYLGTVAVCALLSGILLDAIYTSSGVTATASMHWMLPEAVKTGSAVVLLAVLGLALLRPAGTHEHEPGNGGHAHDDAPGQALNETATLTVVGMTCNHCVLSVRRALTECPGVQSAEVDLSSGRAQIYGKTLGLKALREAVEALGYRVPEAQIAPADAHAHGTA